MKGVGSLIEIRIPKEIKEFKEKLFFGMTIRQLVATIVAIGINVPLYIKGKEYLGDDLTSWLVIIIAIPISLLGFFKYNQMPFERFIKVMLEFHFILPQKSSYKTENLYELLLNTDEEETTKKKKEYKVKRKKK